MLNQTMRVFALLIALTSFIVSFAQSDDGTLLSPNMPLPSPLNLLPIGFKPQAAPIPVSTQPAPASVITPTTPAVVKPVAVPSPASTPITAPRAVTVPTPTEPTSKPVEVPVGLVMPIVVSTNIPKPIVTTPAPPRVVASVAPKPAPKPVTAKPAPKPAPKPVAAKPVAVKPAPKPSPVVRTSSSRSLMVITAKSTAYNSLAAQTDSSPFVTATGARTRFGVVALSRDLLRRIPYGSIVRIEDLGTWANGRGRGTYNRMLSGVNFIVEDTMNIRKRNTVDVWMPSRRAAIQWGARQIRVTVIRLGRR